MNLEKVIQLIKDNHYEESFADLYGSEVYGSQKKRYLSLLDNFSKTFNQRDIRIVSTPGRTELGGNHTDHNNGRV
ncbi:MAG: galactokinase, partial [Spirochaetaceae bacterium]|nr:galactokinase [Spirochaetaceae bacterium]